MTTRFIALLLIAASAPSDARADDAELATHYSFEDTLVGGDGVRPGLEVLQVQRGRARESLIRVREHFIPELLKSIERL